MQNTRVLVTGATGYVGGRLVPRLLDAGYPVRAMGRSIARLRLRPWAAHPSVELAAADVLDPGALRRAVDGCRAVYYLVRPVGLGSGGRVDADRRGADNMAAAAASAGVGRIIYLSPPLPARPEVPHILCSRSVPVTTLEAALIIGSGSASFEILRHLVDRLPLMITPRWITTPSRPIAIRNVLAYLIGCLGHEETAGETYDIGGPEVMTYRRLMEIYAEEAGLPRPRILPVPVLAPRPSAYWIHLVTPVPGHLAKLLVEGLRYPLASPDERLRAIVPQELLTARQAIQLALERIRQYQVESHWGDADRASPAEWAGPDDPGWAGGTSYVDRRRIVVQAPPEQVWRSLSRVGGRTGWYYGDALWKARGALDRVLGGIGLGQDRRDPTALVLGDRVDFWRVAVVRPPQRLVLVAEMKVPGRAWLEFWLRPLEGGHTELVQAATFHPRGLFGILYWYAVFPIHQLLFGGMLRGIAQAIGSRIISGPTRQPPSQSHQTN